MRLSIIVLLIVQALCIGSTINAQDIDSSYRIIGGMGLGISFNEGNFSGIPSVQTCCAEYTNTQGSTAEFSVGLRMPNHIKKNILTFQPGIHLSA